MKSSFDNTTHNRSQKKNKRMRVNKKTQSLDTGKYHRIKNKYWRWGDHVGTLLCDMDTEYLQWCRLNSYNAEVRKVATLELKRREAKNK